MALVTKKKSKKFLVKPVVSILILIAALLITYFSKFGCNPLQLFSSEWTCLSGDSGVWGQFGDFLGGILNPILASITLVVVLWTSNEQMKFVHLETLSLKESSHVLDLRHAVENIKNELNRCDIEKLSSNVVRTELSYLATLCERCFAENPKDPVITGAINVADAICSSASMLSIYSILLEDVLFKSSSETSPSYRLSLIGSCFEKSSEILGFMYLIEIKFSKELISLNKTLDILHMLMSIGSPARLTTFDEFVDAINKKTQ